MTYIPKNKIETDLYTPGGEYAYESTGAEYVGYYYKLYDGKIYTGNNPNIKPNDVLIPYSNDGETQATIVPRPSIIPYSPLLPTAKDYMNGMFTRYFIVKRNQPIFTEVSKALYDQYSQRDPKVSWDLYKPFSLKWMLTGNIKVVAEVNKNMIESTEAKEKAFGLKVYLKENYTQYYKSNP
jgi:hypothetical protein